MRHKFSHRLIVLVLLASNVCAQQATTGQNAPDVERLRAHVSYLASGKLDGRRTGTPGAELAAQYIAEEFKRLGLRASGRQQTNTFNQNIEGRFRSYLQAFPYVAGVELGKNNAMNFFSLAGGAATNAASLDLRLREDWMPLGWSANGRAEKLPVTFVGYGISAADLNHDDYSGADVRGRIALALVGTPDGDNPQSQFARYAELRFKAVAARDRGAKALVVVSGEENFQNERLARLRYDHGGDAGLPIVVISRQAARRIFEAAGIEPTFDKKQSNTAPHSGHTESAASAGGTPHAETPPAYRSASAPLLNVALSITVDAARRERPAHNVVGVLEGSDPNLKNESIIIGAHYDHLGRGGQGSLAAREGEIHHGADDNASGTAGLIELARLFAGERNKLRRTIVFVAFGGEEEGLLGSNFYVNNPAVPLAQTIAMINMDMIGRLKEDRLMIGGAGTASEWKAWIERINSDPNIKMVGANGGVEPASVNVAGGEFP
ncbi:MAG TPA: M28 family peptidase, partial [Pyrinomonadaceae bacterium]|nr:M28 family peptidase [Pyrinomonadaceae bacterium]